MRTTLLTAATLLALSSPALAQAPGHMDKGSALAHSICAQCHAVGRGRARSPNPMAPRFSDVAATPGMTDRALRVWLQSSHPTMPNFMLNRDDTDDLVAYILGLKATRATM